MTQNVGMAVTENFAARVSSWSTSTLMKTAFPSLSYASFAKMGLMAIQGPHHVAKKSAIIGTYVF